MREKVAGAEIVLPERFGVVGRNPLMAAQRLLKDGANLAAAELVRLA